MDRALLQRAQTVFDRADQCLVDLGATKHLDEIEMHWAYFLVNFERIFHRIAAAAGGPGDAWYGRVATFRKTDPLLKYLLHARNADEHGIADVTQQKPEQIREVGVTPISPNDATELTVHFDVVDPHVALTDVIDRSVSYSVPTTFRGGAIATAHPLNVGLLALSYAAEVLSEAWSDC
ncbi:hypothetical protein [Tardiphaga sp.]|uniref:hypothetical protein n=1 Tax=Tardiphaga sp. TaxID=1926292 RepID=UPI0026306928|nr:hypothetical protein [Tardiphaga sp.]MDB5616218.1 hypothetical protein [Tardiphaga sp.]